MTVATLSNFIPDNTSQNYNQMIQDGISFAAKGAPIKVDAEPLPSSEYKGE